MASKLKRRSSVLVRNSSLNNSVSSSEDPNAEMEQMDDEARDEAEERRARTKKRHSLGRAQLGHGTPAAGVAAATAGTPAGSGVSGYSAAKLAEHYNNCMKLSAENKINVKNAFQLRLIDYMAEMLKKKKSDMDNFQAASCALDASTKIYAYRVDSVHNETMKLASGVGSGQANKNEADKGENAEDLGEGEDGGAKKPKKKRRKANTVEKNLNNINCVKFDLEFDIDPLFKKVSAQFDAGGSGGQFLSTLAMKNDTCELILDSSAHMDAGSSVEGNEKSYNDTLDLEGIKPVIRDDALICPTFSRFSFRDWSLEQEELDSSMSQGVGDGLPGVNLPPLHNDDHAFDADAAQNDFGGDDDGGFFGDDANEFNDDMGGEDEGGNNPMPPPQVSNPRTNLWDHIAVRPSEYSYFDTGSLMAWAGPKHWQFSKLRRMNKPAAAGASESDKKKKKEKELMVFSDLDSKTSLLLDKVVKAVSVPKKCLTLQPKTIASWDSEKYLLPEDFHYSGNNFSRLHSMKGCSVEKQNARNSQPVDDSVAEYDYDNLNDSQNFCPNVDRDKNAYSQGLDNNFDDVGGFTNVFSQTVVGEEAGGIGLVAAPNRVEKIQIGYAKHAKKVDMRKLKNVEWSLLENSILNASHNDSNKENKDDSNSSEVSALEVKDNESKPYTFSDMYKTLKQPTVLPSKMTESLSLPLAFLALLHLCNEKTLTLESTDPSNITIKKG